jgi:hypothetical protein
VTSDDHSHFINLMMVSGVNNNGFTSHKKRHPFHKVEYTNDHTAVDFFKSIFLPIPMLRQYWYTDRNGNLSPSGIAKLRSPEAWSKRYSHEFYQAASSKLKAWCYEREYRLILPGGGTDYSLSKDMRKATYDFVDLEGVIFGMNTPHKDKLDVMRIIEGKCRKEGRTDFKFYQAYYSAENGQIDALEMGLLKWKT